MKIRAYESKGIQTQIPNGSIVLSPTGAFQPLYIASLESEQPWEQELLVMTRLHLDYASWTSLEDAQLRALRHAADKLTDYRRRLADLYAVVRQLEARAELERTAKEREKAAATSEGAP